jgi:hypothetical protein
LNGPGMQAWPPTKQNRFNRLFIISGSHLWTNKVRLTH